MAARHHITPSLGPRMGLIVAPRILSMGAGRPRGLRASDSKRRAPKARATRLEIQTGGARATSERHDGASPKKTSSTPHPLGHFPRQGSTTPLHGAGNCHRAHDPRGQAATLRRYDTRTQQHRCTRPMRPHSTTLRRRHPGTRVPVAVTAGIVSTMAMVGSMAVSIGGQGGARRVSSAHGFQWQ